LAGSFFNFFFPDYCLHCETLLEPSQKYVCVNCRHDLPLTHSHKNNGQFIKKVFYGRLPLQHAISLLYFYKGGITQDLIHQMKYKNTPELSSFFGRWLAEELRSCGWKNDFDVIIPVPLHKRKKRKRGYNQVEGFGKALAEALEIPYKDTILKKHKNTETQVFKTKTQRTTIKADHFSLKNVNELKGKHVLLIDDVLTTGTTLEACGSVLLQAENIKLSIATIAITDS
jgi:ComF family protein